MKNSLFLFIWGLLFTQNVFGQSFSNSTLKVSDPWSKAQLIQPSTLAAIIKNPKAVKPKIYNIGVVEDIKGAINMGAANEKENLERFKKAISKLPKNTQLIVYCGCCPFDRCPNIRPAFKALQSAGLTQARLLNLPTNIKVDWINKGYPLNKSI